MTWLYSIVFAGLMFSSGTDSAPVSNTLTDIQDVTSQTAQQNETERIEKSLPLNANGRLHVSNVNGSITLMAWDRDEVKLIAVKTADTKEHLDDVDIKIESRPDYLSIESDYGDWKTNDRRRNNGNVTVDYTLTVPRGAVLNEIGTVNGSVTVSKFTNFIKVSAVNGTVRATNLRGTANLSTVNGEVVADMDLLEAGTKISLETVNGSASLIIPSDSNATVKAESLNGAITNDFGLPVRKGKYVGRDLYGKLGSGEVSIKLESVNGPLSVKHRNDGRPLSPATNLLPAKGSDDEDGDSDSGMAAIAKTNREIDRSVAVAQRQAMRDAQKEMSKIRPEIRVNTEAIKASIEKIDAEVQTEIKNSMDQQRDVWAAARDADFLGVPRIESKSDSIVVKGTPKITVDAKGCSVRIHGWDKQEVQYSISQLANNRTSAPVQVSENHTDSAVTIRITNNSKPTDMGPLFDSPHIHLEIFVPRKSNLKIASDGEIRLDGVSGDLEVMGGDEPVNIRDSQGKLTISNGDGRIRVIGFDGDVNAKTGDGDVYLEGKFDKLSGRADSGTFTVTLPSDSNADFSTAADVEGDGFDLTKQGSRNWRLGNGGSKYSFDLGDGKLIVRNTSVLAGN